MEDFKNIFKSNLLQGEVTKANYIAQEVAEYENNPFIEALPPIFDDEEIMDRFTSYPPIKEEEREKRINVRYHFIKRLKDFIQPLEKHFRIERSISTMIRRGYLARNPLTPDFLIRLQTINKVKSSKVELNESEFNEITSSLRSTADGFSIIGISGIGKTTSIERLLTMYPQVIRHTEYKGNPLTRTQIVWLKIDCPFDGSIKTLCKMFFKAVDDVLGGEASYFKKFGKNNNSAATMMIHMSYLSSKYGIGLLVIDEMQHLIKPKGEANLMLNFFVTLINIIGVPLVLVGTFKALKILAKEFRQARRAGSEGDVIWDRMKKDESDWNFFLETLWSFQWLKNDTPLTDELREVMYDNSQGITAIAVALFILSQENALNTKEEKLTKKLIAETAKKDLRLVQKMIKALRANDPEQIAKYEDIAINIADIIGKSNSPLELRGRIADISAQETAIRNQNRTNIIEQIFIELSSCGIFCELNDNDLEEVAKNAVDELGFTEEFIKLKKLAFERAMEKNRSSEEAKIAKIFKDKKENKGKIEFDDKDLRKIYKVAIKYKKHICELLLDKGITKDPVNEFTFD